MNRLFVGLLLLGMLAAPLISDPLQAQKSTRILDKEKLLGSYAEPGWFLENVPFLDIPDTTIQNVYYYRWSTIKRHFRYANPEIGFIVTEFVSVPWYAQKYGAINAAAGHHIYEARWIRDQRYMDDYQTFWFRKGGNARQYSFWAADAYYARFLVNGNREFLTGFLPDLDRNWEAWNDHYNPEVGLYWQIPDSDAMENTIGSYQTDDPYKGGAGYRPSINAYQYGDALAIAAIAEMKGNDGLAARYRERAATLKQTTIKRLWDPERKFFFHVMRDENPGLALLDGREEIGFIPWYFNMPDEEHAVAWAQLIDPEGFYAPFGPTTAERRHRLFMKEAVPNCCKWNGVAWPYATSQTLTAMANLLNNYQQTVVSKDDYYETLKIYAGTQYKNGKPYIAEANHPLDGRWIYNGRNHSEHYNHSTYNDLVISGLIGVRPRADDVFEVNPLVPDSWDYFALEDVPYHGHLMTVIWDRNGNRYGRGSGLQIFEDGRRVATSPVLQRLTAKLRPATPFRTEARVNLAANSDRAAFAAPSASYTSKTDSLREAVDGKIYYDVVPRNRWTNLDSPNREDWYQIAFAAPTEISEVNLYLYENPERGILTPESFRVEIWKDGAWKAVKARVSPRKPAANDRNRVTFKMVTTDRVRVVLRNQPGKFVGMTEITVLR